MAAKARPAAGGNILRPETRQVMIDHAVASEHKYGDGLGVDEGQTVGHSGIQFTDRAWVQVQPPKGIGVAVYANTSGMSTRRTQSLGAP